MADIKSETAKKPVVLSQHNHWEENSNLNSILDRLDEQTLVVFDIDYTLVRSTTSLGTPEWCLYLVGKEVAKGNSREEGFKKWYPVWLKAQQFNQMELMEAQIPIMLEIIKRKTIGFIALTSRHPVSEDTTVQQFIALDLEFDGGLPNHIPLETEFKYPTLYRKNILYAHDLNEKSEVFRTWLQTYLVRRDKSKPIKRIIFIDDLKKNVISMGNIIKNMGLDYIGIRYSAGDPYKTKFNPALTERQANILSENYSYADIKILLQEE